MPVSLFRRVTRYAVSPSLDPRENRLTEVTAAVLENVDRFVLDFAASLLDGACAEAKRRLEVAADAERDERAAELARRCELRRALAAMESPRARVRTQVPTTSNHFVDLELHLRQPRSSPAAGDMLLWIEVKHGAGLHGDQLDVYSADIKSSDATHKAVILLAPRRAMPLIDSVPSEVPAVEWQDVARKFVNSDKRSWPNEQRWLLQQYSAYLKEEVLMDPDALTATYALALLEQDAAAAAAEGVCELADEYVQKHWGPRGSFQQTRKGDPAYGIGYWANFSPHLAGGAAAESWRGGWFEWGLRATGGMEYLDEKRGSWTFTAGATLHAKANPAKVDTNQEWLSHRRGQGFAYYWHSGYYRLSRLRYPDELLNKTSLEDQGRLLGEWIVETLTMLADAPPPT